MRRKPNHPLKTTGLSDVLTSPAFARLVLYFALHDEPDHVRGLQRRTGLSMSSLHRELNRLEKQGVVTRREAGSRVFYQPVEKNPRWLASIGNWHRFLD